MSLFARNFILGPNWRKINIKFKYRHAEKENHDEEGRIAIYTIGWVLRKRESDL